MIGHYLLTLTPEQEDRVLTTPMVGMRVETLNIYPRPSCLVQAIYPTCNALDALMISARHGGNGPARRYDLLCQKWGEVRINAAIRNRILANQARRTLQPGLVRASL